jgi:heme-degrading monooxygenase HmoA
VYIQLVKLKSSLPYDEVMRVMEERAPEFRAIPGLVQKYYGHEKETGEFCGVYIWESEESLKEFRQSELARTIPVAYKADGQPRIEVFDVISLLRS